MKITTFIVALLLASVSFAKVPAEIRRTAGYNFARALLKQCNSSEDVLSCLTERGAECSPVADKDAETYRCEIEISIDATKQRASSRPPELVGRYNVSYLVAMSRKGWSGKTESVTLLKD